MKIEISGRFKLQVLRCICTILAWCLSLLLPRVLTAGDQVEIQDVRIGIQGYFQVGLQAPLEFRVNQTGTEPKTLTPQIKVVDPDGHGVISTLPEIQVGQEPVLVQANFRSGKIEAPVYIEILEEGRVIASKIIRVIRSDGIECLKQDAQLWMIAGEQPGYEAAVTKFPEANSGVIRTVDFETNIAGISDSLMLESVSLIVLNADTILSEHSSNVIQDWVQHGGRLVISVGKDVESLRASPLSQWLPQLPTGQVKIQNLSSLNQLIPGSEPLRFLGTLDGALLNPLDGHVLVSGLETPLAMRVAHGLGTITISSIRLDQKPLSNWESRAELAMLLSGFDTITNKGHRETSIDSELNPTGVTDLQTQIIQSLDQYTSVQRPSYWVVIGWGALLLVLIGPVDYLLVHRVFKKPQLTWLTLSIWLLGMTLWTYSSAKSTNAVASQIQQIELVDVDLTTQKTYGRAWLNFYSTATRRYDVKAGLQRENLLNSSEAATKVEDEKETVTFEQTSWVGRPETSYRGMYRSGGLESQKPSYHLESNRRGLPDLPVRTYSTGLVGTVWESKLSGPPLVDFQLQDPGNGRLTGSLTYHGPQELTEWFVAYGNFAYFPRTARGASQQPLRKGDEFQIGSARSNLLRGVLIGLTHTSIFKDGGIEGESNIDRQVYNPLSRTPYPILRTLSFHDVTGGAAYTQLSNQTLRTADLSPLLHLRRAVLFGKLKTSITQFSVSDLSAEFEQQESVIRIILPVEVDRIDVNAPPDPSLLKIK